MKMTDFLDFVIFPSFSPLAWNDDFSSPEYEVAMFSSWDTVMSVVGRTLVRPDVQMSTLACIHSTGYIQSQNVYLNKI